MRKDFAKRINDMRGLIGDGSAPVLLAVSGGVDSLCMAELFASLTEPVPFAVAHCNFCLRGQESDGDEQFVRAWADSHSVRFHSCSFDTVKYAGEHGISIEMAARELRYNWFAGICASEGYVAVAVAHNANDNAETLVLNLVRGTGLKGIGGMTMVSELPCAGGDHGILLLRPMLSFTRKQIEGFMMSEKLPHREDSTNSSVEYKRNSIRHEIFPVLEKLNPSFVRTLNREMKYFSEISDMVDDHCSSVVQDIVCESSDTSCGCMSISTDRLLCQKHWRYLLFHILAPFGFNSSVLESLENLLVSDRTVSGKRFESESHVLYTERDVLVVRKKNDAHVEAYVPSLQHDDILPVHGAGDYCFNGASFIVEVMEWNERMPLKQPEGVMIFDAGKLHFPFVCRSWRQGDWMIPLGMKGKKKISDMFADLKYGHRQKQEAVMIIDCEKEMAECQHVAGLLGVRQDDRYKVGKCTSSVIRIMLKDFKDQ